MAEDDNKKDDSNFFEKFGLEVQKVDGATMEIGSTYPLYGAITSILSVESGAVNVIVNNMFKLTLSISEDDKVETLKERAFEPGIFVVTLTKINEIDDTQDYNHPTKETVFPYEAGCSTIVFGRKQAYNT